MPENENILERCYLAVSWQPCHGEVQPNILVATLISQCVSKITSQTGHLSDEIITRD